MEASDSGRTKGDAGNTKDDPTQHGNGGVTVIDGIATGRIFAVRGLRAEVDPLVDEALGGLAVDEGEVERLRADIRGRGLADEVARLTASLNRSALGDAERRLLATPGVYETLVLNAIDTEGIPEDSPDGLRDSVVRNLELKRVELEQSVIGSALASAGVQQPTQDRLERMVRLAHERGLPLKPGATEQFVLALYRDVVRDGNLPELIDAWFDRDQVPKRLGTPAVRRSMISFLRGLGTTFEPAQFAAGEYDEHFLLGFDRAQSADGSGIDPLALTRPQAATQAWNFEVETFEDTEAQGVVKENILAAGALDYVYCLGDLLGVYRYADALVLRWATGILDIADTDASSKLYRYWKLRSDRMSAEERGMLYRRVLAKGDTEMLAGAVVNEAFPRLWHALMSEVSRYIERTELSSGAPSVSRIPIYRATEALQYDLSEHMTGMAHMQVTEMYAQLQDAFAVLGSDEVVEQLSAGRRKNVWTVIERLAHEDGRDADVATLRTLAVDGNRVFGWVAGFDRGGVDDADFEEMLAAAESWIIAASGVEGTLEPPEDEEDDFDEEDESEWDE